MSPDYLNIRHLGDGVLNLVKHELTNRINQRPGFLLENSYANMLAYLDQPLEKNLQNSFDQLKKMDARRNKDSSKIFKRLYSNHD